MTDDAIVVQVSRGWNNQTVVELLSAPDVADDIGVMPFQCDMATLPPWTQAGAVQQHGQILFKSLMESHDRVREALTDALKLKAGRLRPIYLHLKALPTQEVYCWEALCDGGGNFVALDRRWPIARVVQPKTLDRSAAVFEEPLRIFVVLSALGRDPRPEWENLYQAVQAARKSGIAIDVRVATGDEPLQDHIFTLAGKADGTGDRGLTQFALQSAIDLIDEADAFMPHLVHFFCHGSASLEKPRLQVATIQDKQGSSIELHQTDLLGSPGISRSWLAVLNCCEIGAGSQDVQALTSNLVLGGLRAAIGMKETVTEIDAHEFSRRLYPDLLEKLVAQLKALVPGAEMTLDWSSTLWAPRKALRDQHQQVPDARQWTVPVLYAQPEPLRVKRGLPLDPKATAHDETMKAFLAFLPEDQRKAFEAELAAKRAGM